MKQKGKITSKAYQLIEPFQIEEVFLQHELKKNWVVVEPRLASICNADVRYYTGNRRKEALAEKLPIALFHEGIGKVVKANHTDLLEESFVVISPNIPAHLHDEKKSVKKFSKHTIADNHDPNSIFIGSDTDGIAQQFLTIPRENVIPIPDEVPENIALLSELSSIPLNALKNVQPDVSQGKVAVFGDGPVGYVTAAVLYYVYKIPKNRLIVFGAAQEKLAQFDFATTYLVQTFDFAKEKDVLTVIECTGGPFSQQAINQAIDLIEPEGTIILLGVTEEHVPINTRDVLEKGLTLAGNSRSTSEEFQELMEFFKDPSYQKALKKLLPNSFSSVTNAADLAKVFDEVIEEKPWQKSVISFEW